MPTSPTLTEQLETLGIHLPPWPEEPEGGSATVDWIQRGQAYAEGVRLWRAQLRNAPESTKGVVDQLLRHLQDTEQVGVWDQLVYGAIKPEVQGSADYEPWQACTKLIRSSALTPAQLLGTAILNAKEQNLIMAIEAITFIAKDETIGLEVGTEAGFTVVCEYLEESIESSCCNDFSTWLQRVKLLEYVTHFMNECHRVIESEKEENAAHDEGSDKSGLTRFRVVKCVHEFLQAIRAHSFQEASIQYPASEPIDPRLSAFFEHNGMRLAMNKDKATDYHIQNSTSKLERLNMFVSADASIIIDCGAHVGIFSAMAATKAIGAKIYMFEPDSDMHRYVAYNMPVNSNYTLYGCALGGAEGTGSFFKSLDSSQTSSLCREATGHFSKISGLEERVTRISRLSDFLSLVDTRIDYLKIDIQGQEMLLVEDLVSADLLDRIDVLAVEASFLDYNSISCVEVLRRSGGFKQALVVNSVYGGGDIVWHRLDKDLIDLCPDLHKLF